MSPSKNTPWLAAALLAAGLAGAAQAAPHAHAAATQPPMPHTRQALPPTPEQSRYNLPETRKPRLDLLDAKDAARQAQRMSAMAAPPECKDMNRLAGYSGSALAQYIVDLPDYECHYGLFSLDASLAARVYSVDNLNAVAWRFSQEAARYDASGRGLVNLAIYLRAGYYLAGAGTIGQPPAWLNGIVRPAIGQLLDGPALFRANTAAPSTAGETLKLITNMHDEAWYLAPMKRLVQRYTNSAANPNAAAALRETTASQGFTGVLTVLYYAHFRPEGTPLLRTDASYAAALNAFVVNDKAALLGTDAAFQLNDASREAFRFLQYPELKPAVKAMVQAQLRSSSMTGADGDLWLAAAEAVKYFDSAACADYGTCNYEQRLADAVLKYAYTCSPTIRIRAQDMSTAQMQSACALLQGEEGYFHDMLQTGRKPVANDRNTSLEVVVFDDYANYGKYAGAIYGIDTDNGGMYVEGEPDQPGNQARFIAHEASWLRPQFKIWNLEHEYIHYLDGRFDMMGDFAAGTAKPSVWWIEGVAEYLSLKNDNQKAIDEARKGTYTLSQIFGNTYGMADYVTRAYRWGYMATRFMNERHRNDVDAVVTRFRVGDYEGYQRYMDTIGTRYDAEFASWVLTASTAGEPPLPGGPLLPACPRNNGQLGKGCSLRDFSSTTQTYAYILLPAGAKNLRLWTNGGRGDVDLYVALDRYPTTSDYDLASAKSGNNESVSIASPAAGRWYYIVLKARQPFAGVSINATYD